MRWGDDFRMKAQSKGKQRRFENYILNITKFLIKRGLRYIKSKDFYYVLEITSHPILHIDIYFF